MFASPSIYGLRIQANKPLPGLSAATSELSPDIRLFLRETPDWLQAFIGTTAETKFACPETDEQGRPLFAVAELNGGNFYRLSYCDGAEFVVDCAGTRTWVDWPDTLNAEDISTYLFGPVIGWILRLRGDVCLHASAVAVNGAAIAFLGPSGAGKSTTAAAFAEQGHPVLADDVVAIFGPSDALIVRPSYPELRLWSESVAALFPSEADRPLRAQNEKFRLNLRERGKKFQEEPLPLAAVYILNNDSGGRNEIRALTHRDAMMALIANTHAGRLLDQTRREKEFDLLAALVAKVHVREVRQRLDLTRLPELCNAILSDFSDQFGPISVFEAANV